MSNKLLDTTPADKFKPTEGMSSRKKIGLATLALLGLGGGFYGYDQWQKNAVPAAADTIIGEDGATWTKMKDADLQAMFSSDESFLQDEVDASIMMDAATQVIPYHFWTARTSRGLDDGWGVAPGKDFIVMQSMHHRGRWLNCNGRDANMAKTQPNTGPHEKWRPHLLGGDLVAFQSWENQFLKCTDRRGAEVNAPGIGSWEKFHVYKTSSCGDGLDEGEDCIALKNAAHGTWLSDRGGKKNRVSCEGGGPGPWEKWSGWATPAPWRVESVAFDLGRGTQKPAPPQVLGEINNDNLGGSTTSQLSKSISEKVGQTENWGEETTKTLKLGAEFEAGVPAKGKVKISAELESTSKHTIGQEQYNEQTYTLTLHCDAPPHTRLVCKFMVKKAQLDVPYTMTLVRDGGWRKTIHGVWNGVQSYDAHVENDEYKS